MTVTCDMMVSEDGYAAGVNQSLEHPLGEGGERLARWQFERLDENAAEIAAIATAGAYIMGRNMFGPGRGEWDDEWTGWWGGAATARQYLSAGLIDELRLHIATAVLRAGEPLLAGQDDLKLEKLSSVERQLATHFTYRVAH